MKENEEDTRLRIMHGGPFYLAMSSAGMRARSWRAFVLAMLCWVLPLLLTMENGGEGTRSFLHDWGVWAKFLIAPVLLTLSEQPIGFALDECTSIAFRIPLFASQSMDEARAALSRAREQSTSSVPELACACIAATASAGNLHLLASGNGPAWAVGTGNALSIAGYWCVLFSNSVYWFLLVRLVWKHVVWTVLLSAFSKCRLRLAIAHPDGHGGLGFIGLYPAGYALFVLAVSSVVAAGVGHVMERQPVAPKLFAVACGIWLAVVVIYFAAPLAGLGAAVAGLKRKALLLSLARATEYERWNERILLGDTLMDDPAEVIDEPRDVKPIYQAALKTSGLLINRTNLLPILVPALLPLLVVGAFFLPYAQLGPMVKRLLLL